MRHGRHGLAKEMHRVARRKGPRGVANGQVDALVAQVHHAVVGGHTQVHPRVQLLQAAQTRQQPQAGEADGGTEHHGPLGAFRADLAQDILELLHGAVGTAEQARAFRRERDGPMAPDQQLDAQLRFERVDLTAHGGLCQAQVLRGQGDAHAPSHGDEAPQQVHVRETNEWE